MTHAGQTAGRAQPASASAELVGWAPPTACADGFKETEIGEIPIDWRVIRIADSCQKPEYGYTETATSNPIGPRFLRITDIQDQRVDWNTVPYFRCDDNRKQRHQLRPGDILFARIGATTGKSFLVRDCPDAVFASYLIRLRTKTVDPAFLYYFCNSQMYWKQIDANKGDKLKGGVSGSVLAELRHPLPPLPEQRAIAAVLAKIQAAVEVQDKLVATLKELKAATMAKLFREGLRGEPLKRTEIGEIPESWEVVPLSELCAADDGFIQTGPFGSQLHSSDYVHDGVPIINPTHLENDRIRHASIPQVTHADAGRLRRHRLKVGDILFGRRGDVGRHAWVSRGEDGWLCGTGCLIVRPSDGRIEPLYLGYFLSTRWVQDLLISRAVGSIMPNINTKILAAIPVAVPAAEEQRHLADVFVALDNQVDQQLQRRNSLNSLFSSMLHLLMTGRVRVNRPETRDALPA